MNRIKYIIFTAFITITQIITAQVGSPYSQYGAGDLSKNGFGQSRGMGGVGIGLRSSKHLNDLNPAAYTALDSNAVLYELGISGSGNKIENSVSSEIKTGSSIDFFSIGFRASSRWYTGLNVVTSSKIDYILKSSSTNDINGQVDVYYSGDGGLNKIYWANGVRITKNLSLGFNLNYNFGSINRIRTVTFMDDITSLPSKTDEMKSFSGFTIDYGIQYTQPLKNKLSLTIGATYSNPWNVNTNTDLTIGTIDDSRDSDGPIVNDLINGEFNDTIQVLNDESAKMDLPQKVGFGLSLAKQNKFIVAADFTYQNSSKLEVGQFDDALNDQFTIAAGGEITPDHQSISNYFKRTSYRIGGHYSQSHIRIDGQNINDYGFSLGFGFPLGKTNTSFNITFEAGQRGTTEQNLIKETYGIVRLNLSLSDIWFVKRKYN